VGQFEIQVTFSIRKEAPAKAQRRKGVEPCFILNAFFAPLRLCGNMFFFAMFESDPLLASDPAAAANKNAIKPFTVVFTLQAAVSSLAFDQHALGEI
jgi:hypothetical protein